MSSTVNNVQSRERITAEHIAACPIALAMPRPDIVHPRYDELAMVVAPLLLMVDTQPMFMAKTDQNRTFKIDKISRAS